MDVTAIINVHREGRLIVPAVRSFLAAVGVARAAGLSVEAFCVGDRIDEATLEVMLEFPELEVLEVEYGDLGLARNQGVGLAAGHSVAFLDADDIWGSNWLLEGHRRLTAYGKPAVVHPQWWVSFTTDNTQLQVHEHVGTDDSRYDSDHLVQFNVWTALCMASKSVLQRFPYEARRPGIGFEDWQFNARTAAAGVPHLAAPGAYHFIRSYAASKSLSAALTAARTVPGPNPYFERRPAGRNPGAGGPMTDIPYVQLSAAIREANTYEPRLWPLPEPLQTWNVPVARCAPILWDLQECQGLNYNTFIVTPTLETTKLLLAAIGDTRGSVTFVVTQPLDSDPDLKFHEALGDRDHVVIDVGNRWQHLTVAERLFMLQRFLVQNDPDVIVGVDDQYLGAVIKLNPECLRSALFFYCGPLGSGSNISAGQRFVPDIYDRLNQVWCESREVRQGLEVVCGHLDKVALI